ncbi:MAG: flavodoxin [Oscillospiraceae bacterium]|nr:flavodoxin [Oscillospiraceae bacterium]MBQ4545196.1 flavodoxin [Oscillospiraceae bacterium]MBQ6902547.1 flavodoxin [Oscillospiraceae bacterium]
MKAVVVYKTRYGSTKTYAEWIAEELGCEMRDAKSVKAAELKEFDTVIYGGGLYAEMINGVTLLTKNMDILSGKKLLVYTTGLTPLDCRDYYDKMVMEKNFPPEIRDKFKVFNFLGKMIISELSLPHRAALKTLKKIMSGKENPTEMEKLLIELCDADGDFTDRSAIADLVACASAQ